MFRTMLGGRVLLTPLLADEACALSATKRCFAKCAIEKGLTTKVKSDFPEGPSLAIFIPFVFKILPGLRTLNFINGIFAECCDNGKQRQIKIYQFWKTALIRKYGESGSRTREKVVNFLIFLMLKSTKKSGLFQKKPPRCYTNSYD